MMPRKRRRMLITIAMIVLILIVVVTLLLLYLNTDMFKSNATLFTKYLGQNMENMEDVYQKIGNSPYEELLQQNKYETQTQIQINLTENVGTTIENTENSFNQLKLEMEGQIDKENQSNYQNMNLLNGDKKVAQIEYIEKENTYGIRFTDLFKQFLLANGEDIKEMIGEKSTATEEPVNLPDTTDLSQELKDIFQFSEQEKENIQTRYTNVIKDNISKDNFSKQKNQTIQIDGKKINVNAYTLTLTKEQMNHMYIKMLEQMKQDEVILNKIDKVQAFLKKYQNNEELTLKEDFVQKIEALITDITKNNIGQEEAKITVYENYHNTVRTEIQSPDFEFTMDVLSFSTSQSIQLSYLDKNKEWGQVVTYKKENGEIIASLKSTQGEETKEYSFTKEQKVEGNKGNQNITLKYEDKTNRVEMIVEQNLNGVEQFEEETILTEENAINLGELEEEQQQAILSQANSKVSEKINEIMTVDIKQDDFWKILKIIGLVKEGQSLETPGGITETEKNRFNSKFEILQGEDLDGNAILNLVDAIKENFININVVSNLELKLQLDQYNHNEEMANTLTSFVENNKNRKYNVKVEYNEETGLVSDIVLTLVER